MDKAQIRETIARRAALELKDGDVVNLGIGLPTAIPNYLPEGVNVTLQSENGLVGMGPAPEPGKEDKDYVNAGGAYITAYPGAYACSSADSFLIIRGGHVDCTFLGAMQVDEKGNLANWMIPGKAAAGMGGAMDLVTGAKCTIVMTVHCDKTGKSKIVRDTKLPLTGQGVVDYIVTEKCVFHFTKEGMVLEEIAPGETVENILAITPCDIIVPENVKTMED